LFDFYGNLTPFQELEGAKILNRQAIREKLYVYSQAMETADYDNQQMDSMRERIQEVKVKVKCSGQDHDLGQIELKMLTFLTEFYAKFQFQENCNYDEYTYLVSYQSSFLSIDSK
jgi:hypothetical protein